MGCINNKMAKSNQSSEKRTKTHFLKDSLPKDSKVGAAKEILKTPPQRDMLVQTALKALEEKQGYSLMKELGAGTFGDVYLMNDKKHNRSFAVKIVESKAIDKSETILWPRLNHQNVLPLLEFLPLGKVGAFIMEAQAGSLNEIMDKEYRMSPNALEGVKTWLRDILCGLEYLHSMELCHLDLKVDNILISQSSRAMLCDFTFLKDCKEPTFRRHVGMPDTYRPPEACDCTDCRKSGCRVEIHGKSVDSWGLGMLTVRILTCYYMAHKISAQNKCWIVGVYPTLFEMFQEEKFSDLMQRTLQNSNLSNNDEVKLGLNFIYGFLRLDPKKRVSASVAAQHPFLGQGRVGVPAPDDIWRQKLSMDSQEFREYIKELPKEEKIPFSGEGTLNTEISDKIHQSEFGDESDDSKNYIKAIEKDALADFINDLCSSITNVAFESLGQDILTYCPNKYVITPEDIETITKNTLELIKWPPLIQKDVISRPSSISYSPNNLLEDVDTTKTKDMLVEKDALADFINDLCSSIANVAFESLG